MEWREWSEILASLNYWAILAGALSSMVIGSVWYAQGVFGKPWMKLSGIKPDGKGPDLKMLLAINFALTLVTAWGLAVLAYLLNVRGWADGASLGLFVGLLFVSTAWLTNYLFENRPYLLWKLNAGYATLSLVAMGVVIALWP